MSPSLEGRIVAFARMCEGALLMAARPGMSSDGVAYWLRRARSASAIAFTLAGAAR